MTGVSNKMSSLQGLEYPPQILGGELSEPSLGNQMRYNIDE